MRFPKANLATKKTEFVLKTNCDVNNRKKKQQQKDKINVNEGGDNDPDNNEQENKEFYGIYKPKPRYEKEINKISINSIKSSKNCIRILNQLKNI